MSHSGNTPRFPPLHPHQHNGHPKGPETARTTTSTTLHFARPQSRDSQKNVPSIQWIENRERNFDLDILKKAARAKNRLSLCSSTKLSGPLSKDSLIPSWEGKLLRGDQRHLKEVLAGSNPYLPMTSYGNRLRETNNVYANALRVHPDEEISPPRKSPGRNRDEKSKRKSKKMENSVDDKNAPPTPKGTTKKSRCLEELLAERIEIKIISLVNSEKQLRRRVQVSEARIFQKMQKEYGAYKAETEKNIEEEEHLRGEAATKIQTIYRGHYGRKIVNNMKDEKTRRDHNLPLQRTIRGKELSRGYHEAHYKVKVLRDTPQKPPVSKFELFCYIWIDQIYFLSHEFHLAKSLKKEEKSVVLQEDLCSTKVRFGLRLNDLLQEMHGKVRMKRLTSEESLSSPTKPHPPRARKTSLWGEEDATQYTQSRRRSTLKVGGFKSFIRSKEAQSSPKQKPIGSSENQEPEKTSEKSKKRLTEAFRFFIDSLCREPILSPEGQANAILLQELVVASNYHHFDLPSILRDEYLYYQVIQVDSPGYLDAFFLLDDFVIPSEHAVDFVKAAMKSPRARIPFLEAVLSHEQQVGYLSSYQQEFGNDWQEFAVSIASSKNVEEEGFDRRHIMLEKLALHYALTVDLLKEEPMPVRGKSATGPKGDGQTIVSRLCKDGSFELLTQLLNSKLRERVIEGLCRVQTDTTTALIRATWGNHRSVVRKILSLQAVRLHNCIKHQSRYGTAMDLAIRENVDHGIIFWLSKCGVPTSEYVDRNTLESYKPEDFELDEAKVKSQPASEEDIPLGDENDNYDADMEETIRQEMLQMSQNY